MGYDRTKNLACGLCGHDPACGWAAVYDEQGKNVWLCHDDGLDHRCYERWQAGARPARKDNPMTGGER